MLTTKNSAGVTICEPKESIVCDPQSSGTKKGLMSSNFAKENFDFIQLRDDTQFFFWGGGWIPLKQMVIFIFQISYQSSICATRFQLFSRRICYIDPTYRIVQHRIPEAGASLYFRLFYSSLCIDFCIFWLSVSNRRGL